MAGLALTLGMLPALTGVLPGTRAAAARADDLTASLNTMRTGWDPNEPNLLPATVAKFSSAPTFSAGVTGQVYAQPVVIDSLNMVIVATEDDWVYGFTATGATAGTDMLLHTLGREHVEQMMAAIAPASAARNRPFLSTLEVSAIKTGPAPALNAWLQADEAGRRRLLANDYAHIDAAGIDLARFTGNPLHLELEWYASTSDLVRAMDWLRRNADDTPGRSSPSIQVSAPSCAASSLCRLQRRVGTGRAQPHLAGPQPRGRLAGDHRQLEQPGRAARGAALHLPAGAGGEPRPELTGSLPSLASASGFLWGAGG